MSATKGFNKASKVDALDWCMTLYEHNERAAGLISTGATDVDCFVDPNVSLMNVDWVFNLCIKQMI